MAKSDMEEVTNKTIKEGGILVKMYFDMQSANKDELQPLMADFVNTILKAPGVIYCFGAINEPIKDGEIYSTSTVLTILFKDMGALIGLTFRYTPAAVEVIKPEREYILKAPVLQSLLIDIAGISLEYSKYIQSKLLKPEDYARFMDDVKRREELGRKILGEKKDQQA